MTRFRLKYFFLLGLLLMMIGAVPLGGCRARTPSADLSAPPPYLRRIVLVVENSNFQPLVGARVEMEVEPPTRLVSPQGAGLRTGNRGELELVFEPLPHYDRTAWAGGDAIVEYPVKSRLLIHLPGGRVVERFLDDRESYARYRDPLYRGLDRDPEPEATYYNVTVN